MPNLALLLTMGCAAPDPDPLRGRWVGTVTAAEYFGEPSAEYDYVGSTVELRASSLADGERLVVVDVPADEYWWYSAVYRAPALSDTLASDGHPLSVALDGDTLAGSIGDANPFLIRFDAHRVGELPEQDPDGLDGEWLVESTNVSSDDCETLNAAGASAYRATSFGELTALGSDAVWTHADGSTSGVLEEGVFSGVTTWRYTESGEHGETEVSLDLFAGEGSSLSRSSTAGCSGSLLTLARPLDRIGAP